MAIKAVHAGDPVKGVLAATQVSSSYLGAGEYVQIDNATAFDFWIDDESLIMTFKVSFDAGTTFSADCTLSAGAVYTIDCKKGQTMTLDVKVDSGTPNLGGQAY